MQVTFSKSHVEHCLLDECNAQEGQDIVCYPWGPQCMFAIPEPNEIGSF